MEWDAFTIAAPVALVIVLLSQLAAMAAGEDPSFVVEPVRVSLCASTASAPWTRSARSRREQSSRSCQPLPAYLRDQPLKFGGGNESSVNDREQGSSENRLPGVEASEIPIAAQEDAVENGHVVAKGQGAVLKLWRAEEAEGRALQIAP